MVGDLDVPGVWTASDDPGQAAALVAAAERALPATGQDAVRVRLLTTVAVALAALVTLGTLAVLPAGIPFALTPLTLLGASALLIAVAALSSLLSLRAVARVDPLIAIWVPFLGFAALVWWMYATLAHHPGGQPIGALERAFAKLGRRIRGWFVRRRAVAVTA